MAQTLKNGKASHGNYYLKTFFLALVCAAAVFIPLMLVDGGRFTYFGDFNAQEIPFYKLAHSAVRSGNLGWNQYTDLGANFIGSYSFYLLGSPFFWLTIPFPGEWIEFMMGPLLILKFAFSALSAYIYLHRYVKNQNYAVLAAIMYAFSGFSIFNVFFFHFHEAMIFFPLMLAALDEYMYKRRRGLFALAVAASCFVNYYFFIGMAIFTLIYFILRLIMKSWRISVKDALLLFLEAVLGVGMACVLFVPSILSILQNSRTTSMINGWNAVVYSNSQKYLNIINAFLFPPDLPARPNFTPEAGGKWSSLSAWLPLFGFTGALGWMQMRRKHWLKTFLYVLIFMACVPFLNAIFQLFNSQYYARWFYMLILMMCLATAMSLEYQSINWKKTITITAVATAASAFVIGLMPTVSKQGESQGNSTKTYTFGLMSNSTRFWSYVALALLSLAVLIFVFQFYRSRGEKKFSRMLTTFTCLVSVFASLFILALGKTEAELSSDFFIPYVLNEGADVKGLDAREDNVRVDFYKSQDNMGMFWNMQSISAFHSIVPGSIMEYYRSVGMDRDVASRPETNIYGVRALTSVKWLFDDAHDDDDFTDSETDEARMPGWLYNSNANGFEIWENENYIPMGFSYEYYITRSNFFTQATEDRHLISLRAVIVNDADVPYVENILKPLPSSEYEFTEERYVEDCRARAQHTCNSFVYSSSGFTAEINADKERLIFFSVPYEDGWTATVNGEYARIFQTNIGFMSVLVPQGEHVVIDFKYNTPGLFVGAIISLASVLLFVLYLRWARKNKAKLSPVISGKLPLISRPFSDFEEKTGARFTRSLTKTPLEYRTERIPEPDEIKQRAQEELAESFAEAQQDQENTTEQAEVDIMTQANPSQQAVQEVIEDDEPNNEPIEDKLIEDFAGDKTENDVDNASENHYTDK